MKMYQTQDGEQIPAETPEAVVRLLHASSWNDASLTQDQFMESMASRVWDQMGAEISVDSADAFVADLIKCGLLKEIKGGVDESPASKL